jgi:uncharacterized protein
MTLPGIRFVDPKTPEPGLNVRADVALFVGLVKQTGNLPDWVQQQWKESGLRFDAASYAEQGLLLPVRFNSLAQFKTVFHSDGRLYDTLQPDSIVPSALGLAVQSFFAEGGITCYVVRCGDPRPILPSSTESPEQTRVAIKNLNQHIIQTTGFRADDPSTWRGMSHVLGLPDVAMLSLPDLPELFAGAPDLLLDPHQSDMVPEVFRPAGEEPQAAYRPAPTLQRVTAPRLTAESRVLWAEAIAKVLSTLSGAGGGRSRRDVQLIAAWPLPNLGNVQDEKSPDLDVIENKVTDDVRKQLQLVYPWVSTSAAAVLPEALQSAEGIVAGLLARNAVTRGAFRSAASRRCTTVTSLTPKLSLADLERHDDNSNWLGDGLTLLGRDDEGFLLLSDSTQSKDSIARAASLRRLSGIVLRATRQAGEDLVFEANVSSTWTRLRHRIEDALTELWRLGAFDGRTPQDAFSVRCGPSTMTQNDIDAGRMIADITFTAMQPIERITVTLEFNTGQRSGLRAA